MSLSPEEQRAVRAMSGWAVLDLLARPDGGWPGAEAGGSSFARGWPKGHGYEFSRSGLRIIGPWPSGDVVVEVRWGKVATHAKGLPAGLVERIDAHRREVRDHHAGYPSPYPGIGRPYCWDGGSRHTGEDCDQCARDRADLDAANEQAQREREAWCVERARLDEVERTLLDQAFPLADAPPEPGLLELMEGAVSRHRTIALTAKGYAAAREIERRERAASGCAVRLADLTSTHTGRRIDVAGLSGVLQGVIAIGDRVQLALIVGGARIWTDWLDADEIAETYREDPR